MEENEKTETEAPGETVPVPKDGAEESEILPIAEEIAENEPEGEAAQAISAEDFARVLANPMFAFFARGRAESAEILAQEFEKMLAAGKSTLSEEALMKMTPSAGFSAVGGVALSERQRKIARDAGMSYREYYEIIRTIPTRTK
ncbi:MAG: hypothetical protein IJ021_02795 [Clostridia bacterium]|nr:hypothetical protein [Clostridia bacterium]